MKTIIKENKFKPICFKELFPIFKDTIFALVYMILSNIVHRDIKPENIMKINNKYYLADYGTGVNLQNESKLKNNDFY